MKKNLIIFLIFSVILLLTLYLSCSFGDKLAYDPFNEAFNLVPENLKASKGQYAFIRLTWDKLDNADKYFIYRTESAGGTYVKIGESATLTYDDNSALSVGTNYYYKIKAVLTTGKVTDYSKADYGNTISYLSFTSNLTDHSVITGHEEIRLVLNDTSSVYPPLNRNSVIVSGTICDNTADVSLATTTYTDDTLIIKPKSSTIRFWNKFSNASITVNCKVKNGADVAQFTATFNVFYGTCVKPAGNDADDGTVLKPKLTVQSGIDKAKTTYKDNGQNAEVRVAQGTYQVSGTVATMAEGVSIYGGYDASNWSTRGNITVLEDTRTSGGASITNPNKTVHCPSSVTTSSTTIVDGFTIIMGKGNANAGIFIEGSVTVTNNIINGRNSGDIGTLCYLQAGISINGSGADNAVISNNNIDAKYCATGSGSSYGIYITNASSTISNNSNIDGGDGYDTYGIYADSAANPKILNNTINAGTGTHQLTCIYIYGSHPTITDNFLNIGGSATINGIYEEGSNADPTAVTHNDFNFQGNWYYDNTNGQIHYTNYGSINITIYGGGSGLLCDPGGYNNYSTAAGVNL